ncbi:MAG: universal stress protein [Verrucomicrobiota bacterium]
MYKTILVALDHTKADEALLPHVGELAGLLKSKLLLVHVADGWAARNFDQLKLAESEEMKADREYLEGVGARLRQETGLAIECRLALGDPPHEILKLAAAESCDLIAMTTHGHRLIGDILFGSTIEYVRHRTHIPLLVISAVEKLA